VVAEAVDAAKAQPASVRWKLPAVLRRHAGADVAAGILRSMPSRRKSAPTTTSVLRDRREAAARRPRQRQGLRESYRLRREAHRIDHVGISSDFDGGGGIDGWNSAAEAFNVTLELVRAATPKNKSANCGAAICFACGAKWRRSHKNSDNAPAHRRYACADREIPALTDGALA